MEEFKPRHYVNAFLFMLCLTLPMLATVSYAAGTRMFLNLAANRGNTFVFNPRSLSWHAIGPNGRVIRSGRASGGKAYCPDIGRSCRTRSGVFRVISKGGPNCRSSRYPVGGGGAPMPYCMFYSKYYAIHGSYDVPNHNASHGCIRVHPADARWLQQNFISIGTKVVVKPY